MYSGTAEDRYGTSCAQLDHFDWVMQADYPVGVLPESEEDDSLSDIEPDVCDARVADVFPVGKETVAVLVVVLSCGRYDEATGGL